MQPFSPPSEDLRQREACHVESMGRPVAFPPDVLEELELIQQRYPRKQASILPALWLAQRVFGWVSTEVIEYVSGLCDLPPSHVYGVVSFYTMFHRTPKGKYHLQLCTNLSCQLRGSEHILDCLREKLGIDLGQTSADRRFSLDEVECLAACEMAPMMQVNEDFVGPLTPESTIELIEKLRREGPDRPRGEES